MHYFIALWVLFGTLSSGSSGDRIKSKIYKPIESKYFCFRRMNATNQIGCNSKEGGNVGVVYLINNEQDMNHVVSAGQHWPYVAVITPEYYKTKELLRLKQSSDRVSGVLVLDSEDRLRDQHSNGITDDNSCPNYLHDLYVNDTNFGECHKQEWNLADGEHNIGLMFADFPFPIFLIKNQTNIDAITECFKQFGGPDADWPLCGVQMGAPMNAAKDSVTCLRRSALARNSYSLSQNSYCDPLGGTNIFSTLFETSKNQSIVNDSMIVLSSRLDSFTMFDNLSPGADSSLVSLITLLAVADTLTKLRDEIQQKANRSNVLFALFDGEAFDYIGSSRMAYDMRAGRFPFDPNSSIDMPQIRLDHFSHYIELSQLSAHNTTQNRHRLWLHRNGRTQPDPRVKALEQLIIDSSIGAQTLEISQTKEERPLPPSSLHTFLKERQSMAGVVIANHENQYTNKYYNSLFDDISNVNDSAVNISQTLAEISTLVSKTIYKLLTNEMKDSIKTNQTLVDQLIYCYLVSPSCELFKYVMADSSSYPELEEPLPTYVGVTRSNTLSSTSRRFTYLLLSYLTGEKMSQTSKDECDKLNKESRKYTYLWMASSSDSGLCIRSQAIKLDALSPAFTNYGTDGTVTDQHLYSTWTESQWNGATARIFLMPSPLQQWLTLLTGVVVLIFSFIIVYFLDKKSSKLFDLTDDIIGQQTVAVGC